MPCFFLFKIQWVSLHFAYVWNRLNELVVSTYRHDREWDVLAFVLEYTYYWTKVESSKMIAR